MIDRRKCKVEKKWFEIVSERVGKISFSNFNIERKSWIWAKPIQFKIWEKSFVANDDDRWKEVQGGKEMVLKELEKFHF